MPVMRERQKSSSVAMPYPQDYVKVEVEHRYCSDVNNGRSRPNSPCAMRHGKYSPLPVPDSRFSPPAPSYLYAPPSQVALSIENLFADHMKQFNNAALMQINEVRAAVAGRFSTLNFAYELREMDGLVKSFLERNARYITYAFGIVPAVADMVQLWNDIDSRLASLNSKLEALKRPIPLNWGYSNYQTFERDISYALGNGHHETVDARCKSRVVGSIILDVPYFARANPQMYQFLDQLSIDISLGAVWEAVPFSWLVDWFLPIGLSFESMGSSMRPTAYFNGTISHRIPWTVTLESRNSGPAFAYPDGVAGGSVRGKNYYREPFNGAAASMATWDVFPTFNPHRIALLRDLIYRPKGKEWRTPPRKLQFAKK